MAQHRSAIKTHKQSLKRAFINKTTKTKIKTFTKKLEDQILVKNLDRAKSALGVAVSIIMKAVTKKVLKLNTASRKVKKLTHKVKLLEKSSRKIVS